MPAYKNPLYAAASQFINGSDVPRLTPSQLTALGQNLEHDLDNEICRYSRITYRIAELTNEMEQACSLSGHALDGDYFHLLSTFLISGRRTNRLFRTRLKIENIRNLGPSLRSAASAIPSGKPNKKPFDLSSPYIRPSLKACIFYSKLFKETMDITDRQWKLIEPLFSSQRMADTGRPPQPTRDVLNGIFWKIRTGASWDDLPLEYPSHQTCYRYFNRWVKDGTFGKTLGALSADLGSHGLDISEALRNSDIDVIMISRQAVIIFTPRLQDTWQGSTALLILQALLTGLKKRGPLPKRSTQAFTSVLDAIREVNASHEQV